MKSKFRKRAITVMLTIIMIASSVTGVFAYDKAISDKGSAVSIETVVEKEEPNAVSVEISENNIPLAKEAPRALVNLIMTIITGIIVYSLLTGCLNEKKEEETENENNRKSRKGFIRFLSHISVAGLIIAFVLTEDMSSLMAHYDRWTMLIADILLIQIAAVVAERKDEKVGRYSVD